MKTNTQPKCNVCKCNHRKLALKVNEINICYDCIDFFNNLSKNNSRSPIEEIEYQTKYILSTNN